MTYLYAEPMSEAFTTGPAGSNDDGEILELINSIQPHAPWDASRYDWQYEQPTGGPARRYVARLDGRIVSLYVAVPHVGSLGSAESRIWMVQDVMTRPEARGNGLLHHLGELAFEDITANGDDAHTFPNALSRRSFGRIGWEDRGPVPHMRWTPGDRTPGDPTPGEIAAGVLTPVSTPVDLPSDTWRASGFSNGVRRSAEYLSWRYTRPDTTYEFDVVGGGAGFLVTKWFHDDDVDRLHICDLVVQEAARHLVTPTLQMVLERGRSQGATDVTAWCPKNHPYRRSYDCAGFRPDEDRERCMFTIGSGTDSTWHLSMGDSDVY